MVTYPVNGMFLCLGNGCSSTSGPSPVSVLLYQLFGSTIIDTTVVELTSRHKHLMNLSIQFGIDICLNFVNNIQTKLICFNPLTFLIISYTLFSLVL